MPDKDCVVLFDQNEHGIFFTGQVVTGKVIINFTKPKKLKGIKLQICGYAQCQWRERRGKKQPDWSTKRNRKNVYRGREDYIATTSFLIGSEDSKAKNLTIDPGTYTYTFACPIPLNCPSSIEGVYGHVRYLAKVTFLRSGASNRTHNVGFTVLRMLDLNLESRLLKEPASNEALENFCFLNTRAVHLHVDLQQTGYVPGQMVLVSALVNNESQIDCKKLIILLNLRATYISETPCMRIANDKLCLAKKICGPVPHNSQRQFAETIRVPATPPSSDMLSRTVRVSYEICVIASMNHFMRNPKAVIPITIGNVPLTFAPTSTAAMERDFSIDGPTTSAATISQTDGDEEDFADNEDADEGEIDVDLPPPTYEEAMHMTTNIADNDANTVSDATQFTPRYPVYDVDNIAAANAGNINALTPPPNPPQKRKRRRKRAPKSQPDNTTEKPPLEERAVEAVHSSPVNGMLKLPHGNITDFVGNFNMLTVNCPIAGEIGP